MLATAFSVTPPEVISGDIPAGELVMNAATAYNHCPAYTDVLVSTPVISTALMFSGAAMVLGVAGPTAADHYSILGSLAALAIVIVQTRRTDPSLGNIISVVAGTLVIGVAGPGALVSWMLFKEHLDTTTYSGITFHWWVILGFIMGLAGWGIAQGFYLGFLRKIPDVFNWLFSKVPGSKP